MKKLNLNTILLMYIKYIINYFNNMNKNMLKKDWIMEYEYMYKFLMNNMTCFIKWDNNKILLLLDMYYNVLYNYHKQRTPISNKRLLNSRNILDYKLLYTYFYILNKMKMVPASSGDPEGEINNYNNNNNMSLKYDELLKNIMDNLNYKTSNIETNLSNNFYLMDKYLINKYMKYLDMLNMIPNNYEFNNIDYKGKLNIKTVLDLNDNEFYDYLSGLIEGDGYIGPKGITITNHANDVLNTIFINKKIKNSTLVEKWMDTLKDNPYFVNAFSINIKTNLTKENILPNIYNKMYSDYKINQINNHIPYYNYLDMNNKLPIKNFMDIKNNYWLAGFTAADGSFLSSMYNPKDTLLFKDMRPSYVISQVETRKELIYLIQESFDLSISNIKKVGNRKLKDFKLFTRTTNELMKFIYYFDKFLPLHDNKQFNYVKFRFNTFIKSYNWNNRVFGLVLSEYINNIKIDNYDYYYYNKYINMHNARKPKGYIK
uniref:Homing endonuclease LAGLIDADG domain-containing protein n=1 Tax=Saccharomyces paradoxus TaxID=27291 RepID=A0A1W5RRI2_SACPA|nr:hypothetical protein [Saccharomyces paradoxus]